MLRSSLLIKWLHVVFSLWELNRAAFMRFIGTTASTADLKRSFMPESSFSFSTFILQAEDVYGLRQTSPKAPSWALFIWLHIRRFSASFSLNVDGEMRQWLWCQEFTRQLWALEGIFSHIRWTATEYYDLGVCATDPFCTSAKRISTD